ncbi:MAG TPA: prephenate dehydratase [Pyrinomonadaceae bacterium]|jgi:prephenate dehydratase/chorismate mutase
MKEPTDNPRAKIDAIDDELLRLLNDRAEQALKVGAVKKQVDTSLCDNRREREVLTRLCEQNPGPLDEKNVANIFQRIIDECLHVQLRALHQPAADAGKADATLTDFVGEARVAFQGERGAFSEEAAIELLGETCKPVPRPTFEDLFTAIDADEADYILAPLENSLMGSIHRCYDLLLESSLGIVAEIIWPISHFLIGCRGASLETIETVDSHPVALAQCERFFAAHPHLKRVATDDTAGSVRRVVESGDTTKAAIAGRRAANIYGGTVLREHLEDHSENYTRFALLALNPEASDRGNKISLIVRLSHRPGALHEALRPFVRRGIDLLRIESRPIKGRPWQYNFYLDLQAPARESELRGALDEIREQAEEVRYLGRYSSMDISKSE